MKNATQHSLTEMAMENQDPMMRDVNCLVSSLVSCLSHCARSQHHSRCSSWPRPMETRDSFDTSFLRCVCFIFLLLRWERAGVMNLSAFVCVCRFCSICSSCVCCSVFFLCLCVISRILITGGFLTNWSSCELASSTCAFFFWTRLVCESLIVLL